MPQTQGFCIVITTNLQVGLEVGGDFFIFRSNDGMNKDSILDIEIVKGFMRMCNDGWLQGWHERNGGNLTYRMKEEEVAQCRPFFDPQPREWVNMGVQADNLAGEYFITTGSGKFFRNVEPDPVHSIGIAEINDKGDSWRIVWGLEDGAMFAMRPSGYWFKRHSASHFSTTG